MKDIDSSTLTLIIWSILSKIQQIYDMRQSYNTLDLPLLLLFSFSLFSLLALDVPTLGAVPR